MSNESRKASRKLRFQTLFDDMLSRGFVSLVVWLAVAILVFVVIASAAYLAFGFKDGMSAGEALWTAFSFTTNPELPALTDMPATISYLLITLLVVIAGLFATSALVGIVTTALTSYYEGLQRGFSPVLRSGHIAVLGFNDNVQTLINEFRLARGNQEEQCLVFVDDRLTREEMERHIESFVGTSLRKFQQREGISVICRNGGLRDADDLRRCSVDQAKAIIINDFDDSIAMKNLLAVASLLRQRDGDLGRRGAEAIPTIVCMFRDDQFARAAGHVGLESHLRVLSLSDTLSALIAKTCYQPGLSSVLDEIYSYYGNEFYLAEVPELRGRLLDDVVASFDRAIPIGICRPNPQLSCGAEILINSVEPEQLIQYEQLMTIRAGDELILLAPGANNLDLLSGGRVCAGAGAAGSASAVSAACSVFDVDVTCTAGVADTAGNAGATDTADTAGNAEAAASAPSAGGSVTASTKAATEVTEAAEAFCHNTELLQEGSKSILVLGYDETFDRTIIKLAKYYRSIAKDGQVNCTIKLIYRQKREQRVKVSRNRLLAAGERYGVRIRAIDSCHGYDYNNEPYQDILIDTTRVAFHCAQSNVLDLPILEDVFLSGESFDHVIVLGDLSADMEDADTETLLTLLYLRAIAENAKDGVYGEGAVAPFDITSEIQKMENVNLAYNEYVSDYIISWKFVASLQVQIAENRHRYKILRDLLKPNGSEIQLEPARCYVSEELLRAGAPLDFDALALHLRSFEDPRERRILLGFVDAETRAHTLCPPRDAQGRRMITLTAEDMLVVIKTS